MNTMNFFALSSCTSFPLFGIAFPAPGAPPWCRGPGAHTHKEERRYRRRFGKIASVAWQLWFALAMSYPALAAGPTGTIGRILFTESFDDDELLRRGWYDGRSFTISREHAPSGGCIAYRWK